MDLWFINFPATNMRAPEKYQICYELKEAVPFHIWVNSMSWILRPCNKGEESEEMELPEF